MQAKTHEDSDSHPNGQTTESVWPKIRKSLEDALMVPPADRSAFLVLHCPDDLIRHEVESLLAHDSAAADGFLRAPTPHPSVRVLLNDEIPDPLIGCRIGAYTLRESIARGGMGTVYLAEQEKPRRPVALKVLHSAFLTKSAEKRFDIESHVLGFMQHPNIAHIHEAGSHRLESGGTVRYFAMEYVPKARTIIRYSADQNLSLRDRLFLFLQLCDAVQHGHQKGVIHRDLKPPNILVGPEGRVKVIDFGIARSTDSDIAVTTMHTEAGQLLGTLAYMSPEQCAADPSQIDTTTDVYSLGVILFELLTERMPYDVSNMTIQSAARVICEKEPSRPSDFNRRLRGDIETIILKAIEKDRDKRFQSASDLAEDVRRYLRREPIAAHPPTPWTKALRWASRHAVSSTMIVCAVVGVFMLATVGITRWLLVHQGSRVDLEDDGRQVVVYSWGNLRLHSWDSTEKKGLCCGPAIERPAAYGGGKIALVGVAAAPLNPLPGGLYAFDINGPYDKPLWSARLAESDLPDGLRQRRLTGGEFGPHYISLHDVFPDNPGDEIITVYKCHLSHCVLCIYSLDGRLLYQMWQDGGIYSSYWLADASLLICNARDEPAKEAAQKRGNLERPICHVILAVRPIKSMIRKDYLTPDAADPALRPEWYKYLWPLGSNTLVFDAYISAPYRLNDRESFAKVSINVEQPGAGGLDFIIDNRGREVVSRRVTADNYNADQVQPKKMRKLPPPEIFQLHDDPPTDSWPQSNRPNWQTTSNPATPPTMNH